MKQNVSPVTAGLIVVVALAIIGVLGWFFLFRESTTASPTAAPGTAATATTPQQGGAYNDQSATGAQSAKPAVD